MRYLPPTFCEHANEAKSYCDCVANCSCRKKMCKNKPTLVQFMRPQLSDTPFDLYNKLVWLYDRLSAKL